MNTLLRLILATGTAVVGLLAVVYLVSLLDWMEAPTAVPQSASTVRDVSESSVDLYADCPQQVERIESMIEVGGRCSVDSDCAVASFGCPFGCTSVVNRASILGIQEAVEDYASASQWCGQCMYKCMEQPAGQAVCASGQCTFQPDNPTRSPFVSPERPPLFSPDDVPIP
jgi:hypothetical protein